MPNVNGKKFPYTAKGKKDAEAYAKKIKPMKLGPAKGKPQAKTVKPSKRTTTAKKLKGY
jgi:hypothetical protein